MTPCRSVEGERPLEEAGDGDGTLIGLDLRVREAGAVVDDRVHVVDAGAAAAVLARTVAGDPVTGPPEARVLADVHVQQITGARPLVPVAPLARRPRWT